MSPFRKAIANLDLAIGFSAFNLNISEVAPQAEEILELILKYIKESEQ
ncbi:MAG: hypothetical protein H0X31_03310 [Nostocaceae cyanobacterium]|nr:hypothetical protein [Nostocaceae cyanobacterium]